MKLTNDKSLTAGKRGFLILFLSLLLPVGLFAQSEVIVLRPDDKGADLDETVYQKIFLAGTIDMGKSVDWQKATCDWFRAQDDNLGLGE